MVVKKDRILYLDYLRILAMIGVIILHVSAQNWYFVDVSSYEWKVFNIFDSLVRWSVPLFVMISGVLFLDNDKKLDIKRFYKHNVLRLCTSFMFWSLIYVCLKYMRGATLGELIKSFVDGNYHMWFIYMLIGLYIITPILRKITESKKIIEYFLIVGLIFNFIIPRIINMLMCLDFSYSQEIVNVLDTFYSSFNFHFTIGYVFYYVLGYYLYKYDIKIIFRKILYILGIASAIFTILFTDWYSNKMGIASLEFYSNFSLNVLFMVISLFIFFKYVVSKIKLSNKKTNKIINLSKYSFGIYLVHVFILDILRIIFKIDTLIFDPIVSMLLVTSIVFIVSYIISLILNHIPILKKYIV